MTPRRLMLKPDYGCSPLWEYGEPPDDLYDNLDPAALPLSEPTVRNLRAWAAWFDTCINVADPEDSREVLPEEAEAFDRAGRRLWLAVRRELGGGWVVSYFAGGGKVLHPSSPDAAPDAAADGAGV
jgi:hypothetical protein